MTNQPATQKLPLADEIRIAREVLQQLKDAGISEEDPDFKELFQNSDTALAERLAAMARAARRKLAMAEAMDRIIEEDQARKQKHLKNAEAIKKRIAWAYQEAGLKEPIEAFNVTISMRKGGTKVVGQADASKLPKRFQRVKYEIDKTEVKAALEKGETVEGFSLANSEPVLVLNFE